MASVTIRQLKAFIAVAQERSFARAAERLYISASAVTLAVQDLESEIGLRLFDRSTRSVELTPQAVTFLPVVERILGDLEGALEDLRFLAERQKGSVVVAAAASFINIVLTPAVAQLARTHPGIRVRIIEDTTESLVRRVVSGEVDFGVTTLWRPVTGIDAVPILRDRLGVMFPPGHPMARSAEPIAWSDVVGLPMASLAADAGIRAQIENHPDIGRRLPRPLYEVSNVSALQALVQHGAGVAVVPWMSARRASGGSMKYRPLVTPDVWRELFLIRRERRSLGPAATEMVAFMRAKLRALPPSAYVRVDASVEDAPP